MYHLIAYIRYHRARVASCCISFKSRCACDCSQRWNCNVHRWSETFWATQV